MADTCPTVKVKPWSADQGEFVEINVADFDPEKHQAFEAAPAAPAADKPAKPEKAKRAAPEAAKD